MTYHFDQMVLVFGHEMEFGPFKSLIAISYVFVDLFFVLSGLVIAHVYAQGKIGKSVQSYRRFLWHRLARIYPLHLAVLFVLLLPTLSRALSPAETWLGENTPYSLVTELLLLDSIGLHGQFTWNVVSWSISAEWFAYLLSPIILVIARPDSSTRRTSVAVAVASWLGLIALWSLVDPEPAFRLGAVRGVLGFVVGVATYRLHREKVVSSQAGRSLTFWASVAGVFALSFWQVNEALYVPIFVVMVLASVHSSGPLASLLGSKVLVWLGKISYSVYLVQSVSLFVLFNIGPVLDLANASSVKVWAIFVLWMGSLLGVSTITYQRIELPAQRALRAWSDSKTAQQELTTSA